MKKKGEESGSKINLEWNSELKEPWILEFEKLPVNEERWTCLVTSAIPAKTEDDQYIQKYKEFVASGKRRAIKIISMSDVVDLLKEGGNLNGSKKGDKKVKKEKSEKTEKKEEKPPSPRFTQILNLALKYATFTEFGCTLPPDLMAVLLKYMILKLKESSIREKKIDTVRQRKIRERNLKAKFIGDLKSYEIKEEMKNESLENTEANAFENDEPFAGPDLYIMLTEFFDLFCYPELQRINVPFVAFFKITAIQDAFYFKTNCSIVGEVDRSGSKIIAIDDFWKNLEENCNTLEKTKAFKDIAFIKYTPSNSLKQNKEKNHSKLTSDEMSWMQYAAYRIYCQHHRYLQELYIQKVVLSLEPLDLSKCEVYNKLCDALITGQPLTPLFVLYAMTEQLVAGVPETETTVTEAIDEKIPDFFPYRSESVSESDSQKNSTVNLAVPCVQCRHKLNQFLNACEVPFYDNHSTEKSDRTNYSEDHTAKESNHLSLVSFLKSESIQSNKSDYSEESSVSTTLIDQVLSERKTEKEIRKEIRWKTPRICFFGDSVALQTYHCNPRIIDSEELTRRFIKNSYLPKIWTRYPELPPEEKAFYNFHYNTLLKISQEKDELLRIKIIFTLLMKVAGVSKFYLYKGVEETLSEPSLIELKNKQMGTCSTIHEDFNMKVDEEPVRSGKNPYSFSTFFLGKFILEQRRRAQNGHLNLSESNMIIERMGDSKMFLAGNRSCVTYKTYSPHNFMYLDSLQQTDSRDKVKDILLPILDCMDISAVSDLNFVNQFEEFPRMIEGFRYYENLKPSLMIQRLLEYHEEYNTIHCTYFPPIDSVAIFMHNDSDHRGVFYRDHLGKLLTPVGLRDFYNYVYPDIRDWISEETEENLQFVSSLMDKKIDVEKKKDEKFVAKLKLYYCGLNEAGRKNFLEQEIDLTSEPEVMENELCDLPYKIKPESPNKVSFTAYNLGNLRVETRQKVHEFHSKDGMEVHAAFDSWLYEPSELLILTIRRSSLWLRYYLCLGQEETNFNFTLRTASDIIFVFFKDPDSSSEEEECAPFNVRISWPTGLLIEVISTSEPPDPNRYIKQSYIKTCRKSWDIEEEKSRCYLKTGEILIFKENGDIKVLTASGTIYNLYYGELLRCETVTMTGPVWEQRMGKKKCSGKRRKKSTLKIYIGIDCKTQERYYKRDDGTSCMLWPNGKLVTNYPDGTKITSIPDFDEDEISLEWDDEEKQSSLDLESKDGEEQDQRSRSIRTGQSKSDSQGSNQLDKFVSVSCTYLMEHPKYSTVYCEASPPYFEIRMLENLRVNVHLEGCFEVQQENKYLLVNDDSVRFNTICDGCGKASTSDINFNSTILCRSVDLFENEYTINKNGDTTLQESIVPPDDLNEGGNLMENKNENSSCGKPHAVKLALKQKCFLLERDLSGIEFIHEDNVAHYCHDLQNDTYFDLNTDDPNDISHTFSSSLSRVGYENWVMEYEKDDSLPTNLKKNDLKELDMKENRNKLFKYPFPKNHDVGNCQNNNQPREKVKMPKVKLVRIIKCLPLSGPQRVIKDVCGYVSLYQKRAREMCQEYEKRRVSDESSDDELNVKMRLKKIAVTLSQSLTLYPHVCTQLPSTDADVHYFGHLIGRMEDLKGQFHADLNLLPNCKQIPKRLPNISNFPTIHEENES